MKIDYDIAVIGGGVIGTAIGRELSRFSYRIIVLEKEADLCEGTSKANSGIVHAGFDCKPGSLMARMNVRGNQLMEHLCEQLDIPFKRNGSLVLCMDKKEEYRLHELMEKGIKNGVKGLQILSGEEVREREPKISGEVCSALYAPSGGIVCPFTLNIAMGENACENGVEFRFCAEVKAVEKTEDGYVLHTEKGEITAKIVINAAGVYADEIHNMVSKEKIKIIPRKGEYCLMDKNAGGLVKSTIFQLPTKYGKGVLITPTVHGNILAGPTAEDIEDREDTATTAKGLETVLEKGIKSVPELSEEEIITSFSGLRAHTKEQDFRIEEVKDAPGFFDVSGIESPGLSSAPAIGEYVSMLVRNVLPAEKKGDFKEQRTGIPNVAQMSFEEREQLIQKDPSYANVICRCELVTEGEIREAIRRRPGAVSADGIKRRTRAGMGRCQSGFCSPKVTEILAEELGCDRKEVIKNSRGSELLCSFNKEDII